MELLQKPPSQIVKVLPAIEGEVARGTPIRHPSKRSTSTAPIRCQLWDDNRFVNVIPVRLDDMGHPTDITYNPFHVERITKLAFIWGKRTFDYVLPQPVIIRPGNPLHLALGHMKLLSKFGLDALQAGH